MYNNTIHYLCILIRIKQLYPRNFLTTLLFQLLFLIIWNSEAVQYFSRIPRTSQNESYSIEQFVQIFGKRASFRFKVVPHPPPSIHRILSHGFLIGSNEACVAGEYDLRRDSFERIEKQPAKDDRAERIRARIRWRDDDEMEGPGGLMKNSAHSWLPSRCCCHRRITESIYPWIDLIIVATPLDFDAWLTRPTRIVRSHRRVGNYAFAIVDPFSRLSRHVHLSSWLYSFVDKYLLVSKDFLLLFLFFSSIL